MQSYQPHCVTKTTGILQFPRLAPPALTFLLVPDVLSHSERGFQPLQPPRQQDSYRSDVPISVKGIIQSLTCCLQLLFIYI